MSDGGSPTHRRWKGQRSRAMTGGQLAGGRGGPLGLQIRAISRAARVQIIFGEVTGSQREKWMRNLSCENCLEVGVHHALLWLWLVLSAVSCPVMAPLFWNILGPVKGEKWKWMESGAGWKSGVSPARARRHTRIHLWQSGALWWWCTPMCAPPTLGGHLATC